MRLRWLWIFRQNRIQVWLNRIACVFDSIEDDIHFITVYLYHVYDIFFLSFNIIVVV